MRDSQRSKVYRCDTELVAWAREHGALATFPTRWEIEAFAARVHVWMKPRCGQFVPATPPTVKIRKGGVRSLAYISLWTIAMLRQHMNAAIVLHELAHLYARRFEKHGPDFARKYLLLVTEFMGAEAGAFLADSFKRNRVRTKDKRRRAKRRLTLAQKLALLERLAKARAARAAKRLERRAA